MRAAVVLFAVLCAGTVLAAPTVTSVSLSPGGGSGAEPPWSQPGDLLYEEYCYEYEEVYIPELDQYFYFQELPTWFFQDPGDSHTVYWISIQAMLAYPPQWGWCETDMYWNDEAVMRSNWFGFPNWTPWTNIVGYHVEMAFTLLNSVGGVKWAQYPVPGSTYYSSQWDPNQPGIDSETADDFLCTDFDPIAAIEWYGGYWNGNPVRPEYFIIRFYSDIPAGSPVEKTSWGSIKCMFK